MFKMKTRTGHQDFVGKERIKRKWKIKGAKVIQYRLGIQKDLFRWGRWAYCYFTSKTLSLLCLGESWFDANYANWRCGHLRAIPPTGQASKRAADMRAVLKMSWTTTYDEPWVPLPKMVWRKTSNKAAAMRTILTMSQMMMKPLLKMVLLTRASRRGPKWWTD